MRKTFKYRLYPTKPQQRILDQQLEECRWLYNHLLAERGAAWEQRQESVRLYDQHATLPALKVERPALAGGQSPVLQTVAVRIDLAFQAFFRRVRTPSADAECGRRVRTPSADAECGLVRSQATPAFAARDAMTAAPSRRFRWGAVSNPRTGGYGWPTSGTSR
jgi:helix-turn-helix protein